MISDPFIKNSRGGVTTIFALSLFALMVISGIAMTSADINWSSTATQRALDAAVLAGAAATNVSDAERIAIAEQTYAANQIIVPADGAEVELEKSSPGRFGTTETTVYGNAIVERSPPLIGFLGVKRVEVPVSAAAIKAEGAPICVLGLDPNEEATMDFNGQASLELTNCSSMANSSDGAGMRQVGGSGMKAKEIGITGGYSGSNFEPEPQVGLEAIPDPLAALPPPSPGACVALSGARITNDTVTLYPGTYCGGLQLQAGTVATLEPGIYIMQDGPLQLQAGAIVSGKEVMIAFLGDTSTLNMYGDTSLTLTSPSSGPYANIQFFGDRNVYGRKMENLWFTVIGGSKLTYEGVLYVPSFHVWLAGNSQITGASANYVAIAKKLWFQDKSKTLFEQRNDRDLAVADPRYLQKTARLIH